MNPATPEPQRPATRRPRPQNTWVVLPDAPDSLAAPADLFPAEAGTLSSQEPAPVAPPEVPTSGNRILLLVVLLVLVLATTGLVVWLAVGDGGPADVPPPVPAPTSTASELPEVDTTDTPPAQDENVVDELARAVLELQGQIAAADTVLLSAAGVLPASDPAVAALVDLLAGADALTVRNAPVEEVAAMTERLAAARLHLEHALRQIPAHSPPPAPPRPTPPKPGQSSRPEPSQTSSSSPQTPGPTSPSTSPSGTATSKESDTSNTDDTDDTDDTRGDDTDIAPGPTDPGVSSTETSAVDDPTFITPSFDPSVGISTE